MRDFRGLLELECWSLVIVLFGCLVTGYAGHSGVLVDKDRCGEWGGIEVEERSPHCPRQDSRCVKTARIPLLSRSLRPRSSSSWAGIRSVAVPPATMPWNSKSQVCMLRAPHEDLSTC